MDERELFTRYRESRDVALRNEIAEKYLYIASVLAKKFAGRGVEYDDLYQVAALALIKGIDRFDPDAGVKFSTFITPTVTGEIKNYFRDRSRLIHLPRRVAELKVSVKKAADELTKSLSRTPTARELAEALHVSEEEILHCMEAGATLSLDSPVGSEDGARFADVVKDDSDDFESIETRDAVARALNSLTETERTLVGLRFGEELSQTETAKRMNVSQMYVSRLEHKILEKLREEFKRGMA